MKLRIVLIVLTGLLLASCYDVKRTDGLRDAYVKILVAGNLALDIKERKDIPEPQLKQLVASYTAAVSSVNSFLDAVKEKSLYEVDIPLKDFYADRASADLDSFISEATTSREKKLAGENTKEQGDKEQAVEQSATDREREMAEKQRKEMQRYENAVSLADQRIKKILELKGQGGKDAYITFKRFVDGIKMVEFAQISK